MDEQINAATSNSLGAVIRTARERAGLSLRHMEAITGIPRPTLHRMERDETDRPSPDFVQRVADVLELDNDALFALMGYRPSAKLPSLAPYLRAKYHLSPHALAEAHTALQDIVEKYDHNRRTHGLRSARAPRGAHGTEAA